MYNHIQIHDITFITFKECNYYYILPTITHISNLQVSTSLMCINNGYKYTLVPRSQNNITVNLKHIYISNIC